MHSAGFEMSVENFSTQNRYKKMSKDFFGALPNAADFAFRTSSEGLCNANIGADRPQAVPRYRFHPRTRGGGLFVAEGDNGVDAHGAADR
jgi:hypothetical protein